MQNNQLYICPRTTQFILDYIVCKRAISCRRGVHSIMTDWTWAAPNRPLKSRFYCWFFCIFSSHSSSNQFSSPFAAGNFNRKEIDVVIVTFVLCHLPMFNSSNQSKSSGNLPAFNDDYIDFAFSFPFHTFFNEDCDFFNVCGNFIRCKDTRKATTLFWCVIWPK